jgi:hypothetical protein
VRGEDFNGYEVASEAFTVPAAADGEGRRRMQLDMVPLEQVGFEVTVGGNPRTLVPYGETVGAGQVGASLGLRGTGVVEFHASDAGLAAVASYRGKGTLVGAGLLNELGAELAAVQGAVGDSATGPGSSTDNAVALFDGTTGKVIKGASTAVYENDRLTVGDPAAGEDDNPIPIVGHRVRAKFVPAIELIGTESEDACIIWYDTTTHIMHIGMDGDGPFGSFQTMIDAHGGITQLSYIATNPAGQDFDAYFAARRTNLKDGIRIEPRNGGTESRTGIVTNAALTADRTWTFPDATGAVVLQGQAVAFSEVVASTAKWIPVPLGKGVSGDGWDDDGLWTPYNSGEALIANASTDQSKYEWLPAGVGVGSRITRVRLYGVDNDVSGAQAEIKLQRRLASEVAFADVWTETLLLDGTTRTGNPTDHAVAQGYVYRLRIRSVGNGSTDFALYGLEIEADLREL